ncbi:MAG: TVP38/TMEM64 family protein [Sulfuricaulis sp.]
MLRVDKKTVVSLLLLGGMFAGLAYWLYTSGLLDLFVNKRHLLAFIQAHRAYAALIFIILQVIQVVAAPVPGEVTGFVGGIFFGAVWGVIYSTVGLTIGSWLAFMVARFLGRPLVERVVHAEVIQRYDYVMRHKGLWLTFSMFLLPGFPKDYLCYLLGLGHMRQRDFLIVSGFGRLLGTVLLTMGGMYFRDARYGALFVVVGISLSMTLLFMIYHDRLEHLLRRLAGSWRKQTPAKKRESPPPN